MSASPGSGWTVTRRHGSAAELHDLDLPAVPARAVWVLVPDRPALVLGSTQSDDVVATAELERRGIDLVRRRSGGGAVLLDADGAGDRPATLWIDLVLPRDDPLWADDVGRSMDWLGDAWVRALAALGVEGEVHRGALERTPASALVCFAGLGPGEVTVAGRKVVGISQRRTRAGARFQCVVHLLGGGPPPDVPPGNPDGDRSRWDLAAVADLLREPADGASRAELIARLRDGVGGVDASADAVLAALVAALPGTAA